MAEATVITDPYTDAADRLKTLAKVMTTKGAYCPDAQRTRVDAQQGQALPVYTRWCRSNSAIGFPCCWFLP